MIPTLTATSVKNQFLIKRIESSNRNPHNSQNSLQSTNSITKHRSNQNYSTIKATINKEYKIAKRNQEDKTTNEKRC